VIPQSQPCRNTLLSIAALLLSGRDAALRRLKQYKHGENLLIAPDLLLAEFASLLGKRRPRKEFSVRRAEQAFDLMQTCALRLLDMRSGFEGRFVLRSDTTYRCGIGFTSISR
jgi:predicted nucleic acid-binding protein